MEKHIGFLTRFLGSGTFLDRMFRDFWVFLEDLGGDFLGMFGGVLCGF